MPTPSPTLLFGDDGCVLLSSPDIWRMVPSTVLSGAPPLLVSRLASRLATCHRRNPPGSLIWFDRGIPYPPCAPCLPPPSGLS